MKLKPGDVVDGRYEVVRVTESGAYGCVADAKHQGLGQPFTLKLVDPSLPRDSEPVQRLEREAHATSLVHHENAIFITDFGRCPTHGPYLVSERREGERLSELLSTRDSLEVTDAVRVAMDVAHAVASAHELGVVHRGLHPDNLLVNLDPSSNWVCKVMGFGVEGPVIEESTAPGAAYADYQAPELRLGAPPSPETDQFALGAIVYRVLTGQLPDRSEIDSDELRAPTSFNSDIPRELDEAVLRSLRRSPRQRFESVEDFVDALVTPTIQNLEPRSDPWDEPSIVTSDEPMTEAGMGLVSPTEPVSLVIEFEELTTEAPDKPQHLRLNFRTHERLRREYRRNIVAGGVFVPTEHEFSLHEPIELEVSLAEDDPVRVEAEVVSVQSGKAGARNGVGLSLAGDAVDALGVYVRKRSGLDLEPTDMLVAVVSVGEIEDLSRTGAYLISRLSHPRTLADVRREVSGLPFDLSKELSTLVERGFVEVETDRVQEESEVALATEAPTEAEFEGHRGAGAVVDFDPSSPWEEPPKEGLDESSRIDYTAGEVERVMALVDYQVRRQNYLAAIRTLQKAIVVSPSVAEFHHRLARLHMQFTGDEEKAMRALQDALQIEPENAEIRRTLRRLQKSRS